MFNEKEGSETVKAYGFSINPSERKKQIALATHFKHSKTGLLRAFINKKYDEIFNKDGTLKKEKSNG